MAFIDRIFRDGNADLWKSNHLIAAGMYLVARGDFTKNQFKTGLALGPDDDAQLDELIAHYQGLSDADKERFFPDWTAWTILAEKGKVSRAAFAARFDLTE